MRIVVAICLMMFCRFCAADEMLYVGHLDYVKLSPVTACEKRNKKARANKDGPVDIADIICITNSCGDGEAVFIIDRAIVGERRKKLSLKYSLSEWCVSDIDIDDEPRLIYISGNLKGKHTFKLRRIDHTMEGREYFFPLYIDKIRNVEMRGLLKNLDRSFELSDSDLNADQIEEGVKSGCLKKEGGKYIWYRGVFLDDLEQQLSR